MIKSMFLTSFLYLYTNYNILFNNCQYCIIEL
nr:MAG TPA: Lecithin retinol acyltransferase [Caudoviricetes sp.]